jgi:CheY-like chemotaxis protein
MDDQTNTQTSKPRVLLVDEDLQVAETIRGTLVSKGFHVEIAENRKQAVNLVTGFQQFDLLITSGQMTEVESLELLKMIRQLKRELPVMIL